VLEAEIVVLDAQPPESVGGPPYRKHGVPPPRSRERNLAIDHVRLLIGAPPPPMPVLVNGVVVARGASDTAVGDREAASGAGGEEESVPEVVVLVVTGFDKSSAAKLSSWMPTVAAQGRLRALEQAWLQKTFGKYGAVALSLPCDTAGHWIPSHGILVSFIRKADARAAVSAMAVRGGGGVPELVVLKGVANDSLELEIKFQGGAMFDPSSWSALATH